MLLDAGFNIPVDNVERTLTVTAEMVLGIQKFEFVVNPARSESVSVESPIEEAKVAIM